jgi:hypothetical protein
MCGGTLQLKDADQFVHISESGTFLITCPGVYQVFVIPYSLRKHIYFTSRMPAVLLRENSKNVNIFLSILLPESLSWAWSLDTYRWIS